MQGRFAQPRRLGALRPPVRFPPQHSLLDAWLRGMSGLTGPVLRLMFPLGPLAFLLACSDGRIATGGSRCATSRIVGGSSAARLGSLDAPRSRAIVAILLPSPQGAVGAAVCSAVAVAPGFVLSAAHCFDADRDGVFDHPTPEGVPQATVVVGGLHDPSAPALLPDAAWLHPTLDVGLLQVSDLSEVEIEIEPLQPCVNPMDESWLGSPVELAGYGTTESGDLGNLAFVIEEIARVEPAYVVVDGLGDTGACLGDSGGPLLARCDNGATEVIGVLDDGDRTCTGEAATIQRRPPAQQSFGKRRRILALRFAGLLANYAWSDAAGLARRFLSASTTRAANSSASTAA